MPPIEIRPFRRPARDQLTALVNAHVAAVVPGVTVSVNAVLSQLEREPDDAIVERLAAYDEPGLAELGFRHLTSTERGWRLP